MVIIRKPRARRGSSGDMVICGVQDTGTRSTDGAGLRHVTAASPLQAATLDTAYFDAHPLFNFPDWTDASGNVFCEIPIAYWWRGNLPDTADGTTPRWTMLMSVEPGTVTISGTECEFTASPGAFKRAGAWIDKFYFGKYRGCNVGNDKVGSKSGQTHWGNVTWTKFKTYCENNGAGYHMISLQEWHEICARAVVEKATFQIMPEAIRTTQSSCKYRGIEEFAYSGSARTEFVDGARTDATGKYELWTEAGGDYETTTITAFNAISEALRYSQGVVSGGLFDYLFLALSMGAADTCFIPDQSGRISSATSKICAVDFHNSTTLFGALSSLFYYAASNASATIGTRLCKW